MREHTGNYALAGNSIALVVDHCRAQRVQTDRVDLIEHGQTVQIVILYTGKNIHVSNSVRAPGEFG